MKSAVKIIAVAAIYALIAHFALAFFATNGGVSIIWPPSGLALAALLLGGRRYAWSVFMGAFAANAITGLAFGIAFAIAVGNTLEALLAYWLLTRHGKFNVNLPSLDDYLRLLILGAGLSSLIAALSGPTVLLLSGVFPLAEYLSNILHWWMGDALGIILLTPLILVWRQPPQDWLRWDRILTVVLPLVLTFLMGQIVFQDWFHDSLSFIARGFLMFLFVSFTAIYLGNHGTVIVIAITATQALLGISEHIGYFANDVAKTGLTAFWFYITILAIVGMAQATYLAERKQIENELVREKQRYQLLLKTATDGIHIIDTQGQLLDASDSFYQMLGYPVGTPLNIKDWDIQWTQEQLLCKIKKLISHPAMFITRHRKSNSQVIDVEINACGIVINGQSLLFASSRDITERKRFNSRLRESESRFRAIANAAPVLIWMSGPDKLCYWFNQVWLDFTGRSMEQEFGNGWAEGVHPDDLQHCLEIYLTSFDARLPFQMEYRLKHHDGEYHWLLDSGVPRYDEKHLFLGYIGSCMDITDSKHAEADLQQFAEIAAHHLQEPARRMLSFAQRLTHLMNKTVLDDDVALMLSYIEQSAIRQRALVSDIQLYLAAGEPRDRVEGINPADIIRTVTELYALQIHDRNVTVTYGNIPFIQIDKARLTDIVSILFDNALRYAQGEKALILQISGKAKAGRVYCRFADNGVGIPAEYRERVFRVFERLQAGDLSESTGIGLAIVKRIVESCNGSVGLQETPGGGVTILFDLPLHIRNF